MRAGCKTGQRRRFRRSELFVRARVEGVAEAVAEEIEGEEAGDEDEDDVGQRVKDVHEAHHEFIGGSAGTGWEGAVSDTQGGCASRHEFPRRRLRCPRVPA